MAEDHIHAQIQCQERDNLSKYQCGSQNLDFGQVQMWCTEIKPCFSKQHDFLVQPTELKI